MSPQREHIQAVLALSGLTLREADRPAGGLSGTVLVLATDQGDFILKVSQDPAEDWKPVKERIIYCLLRRQGIPAPNLLAADCSRRVVPFAYTLCERLPGMTLSQAYPNLSDAGKRGIYRHLGNILGRMHSMTFEHLGDVAEREGRVVAGPAPELATEAQTANLGPFATWREMHREIVRGRLSFLSRTEFKDLVGPISRWSDAADSLLDYAITPRLLHMDLHRSNVLVSGGKITGFLDVEESVIGHNEYDLMRTELAHFEGRNDPLRQAFFGSYAAHVTLDAGYERRRPLYDLSRSLVGLMCLVRFGSSTADQVEEAQQARAHICQLLQTPPIAER